MSKCGKFYDKLQTLIDEMLEYIDVLEEKQMSIVDRADEHGRDMTEREQERYDEIEEEMDSVRECIERVEYAQDSIEDYI